MIMPHCGSVGTSPSDEAGSTDGGAGLVTVSDTVLDVLAVLRASPWYTAVMLWLPVVVKALVLSVAVPLLKVTAEPRLLLPS